MFREMRRFKQQITTEECKKVLKEEKRAAFSVIGDDGYPYTIPINFYYDEADNIIYFHGAKEGHKVDAMNRCDKVCLESRIQKRRALGMESYKRCCFWNSEASNRKKHL